MILTETLDLRGGRHCWREAPSEIASDIPPHTCEVAVIGAGIMGAMIGQTLSQAGFNVTLLDRRAPATGATAGSTALVMWGADVPLTHLSKFLGNERAGTRWRAVKSAVETLNDRIATLDIACGWRARPEIYLAGDILDSEALEREGLARMAAGLPSQFVKAGDIDARFGIAARDALVSDGSYEVDPVALTSGLLAAAQSNGAKVCFPIDVERLSQEDRSTKLHFASGQELIAEHVIIATGYEAARLFLPQHFSLSSSYAIATKPDQAPAWGENALIWEASDPYLYARATSDNRVVVGGEDEDFFDPAKRDDLIAVKRAALEVKAAKLLKRDDLEFECAWASTFGGSPDGLPAIGPARNLDRVILAYGYGGNGVTFASLGAEIVKSHLAGEANSAFEGFDPYRSMPSV